MTTAKPTDAVAAPVMAPGMEPGDGTVGLSSIEAAARLRTDGPNALGGEGRRSRARILAGQFASPLVLILVAASCVSIAVGDPVEAGIILAIVGLSAGLGFVQEARAEASVAALQARLTLRATVIRDGRAQEVPVHDVVRGDVVDLAAGNIVPADGRLLAANHLYVDESSLTGESAAALKSPREEAPDGAPQGAPGAARVGEARGRPATPTARPRASGRPAPRATPTGTRSSSSARAWSAAPAAR